MSSKIKFWKFITENINEKEKPKLSPMMNHGYFLSFVSLSLLLPLPEKLNIEKNEYKFILSKGLIISPATCLLTSR